MPVIPAGEALDACAKATPLRREARGQRRRSPSARAAQLAGHGPGAVRDHPRLLRLARAGRDRLRPGPRRPVRDPRRRQHRRAVADRQRRVRGRALRHAAGRRARPLAVRRDPRDARGAAAARPTNQSRNLRSIVDRIRPVGRGAARDRAAPRSGRARATRRCAPTCAPRPTSCATARKSSSS